MASTVGARGIAIVTALVTVPLTLPYLGPERYGLWMTISSLAAFLIFTDLGVGNGLMTAVAKAVGQGNQTAVARHVASGTWMLIGIGAGLMLLVLVTNPIMDWAAVFNVRDATALAEAGPAVLVFGLCFAASLPIAATSQVRIGFQESYINNAFTAAGNLLGLVLVLVVIRLQLGLPFLVLAMMGAPLVSGLINAAMLFGWQRPHLAPRWRAVNAATSVALLRSGAQFLVLQIAVAGAFYSDTLIAASVVGPSAAGEYAIVNTLFLIPAGFVSAALAPLWPAYAEATARGDVDWVKSTLRRSLTFALGISVSGAALLALLSGPIFALWIDDAVRPPLLLVVGFAVWTVMRGVGNAYAMLLNGLHVLQVQIVTAVVMAALNVTLSIALAARIGVAGVILGSVIAYPLATLIPLALYVPRVLGRIEPGQDKDAPVDPEKAGF